jgi:IclR family transcriptional regulator, acetate operon repressor
MRSTQRDDLPDSVVGRVFTLLTAFRPDDRAVSISELSRRTGICKPTAHRLLHQLAQWRVVDLSADGVRVGIGLFELGLLAARPVGLREAAAPFLSDLYEATGETVHLAVAEGTDVVYVQKLEGRHGPPTTSRVGGRMPAYCTGVGKALLAHAPPEHLAAVVAAGLRRRTPRTIVAVGLLERDLERIRDSAVAVEHEESSVGIACVASPVIGEDGTAVAAVSITGWANRLQVARLGPAVRTAALGISRSLRAG